MCHSHNLSIFLAQTRAFQLSHRGNHPGNLETDPVPLIPAAIRPHRSITGDVNHADNNFELRLQGQRVKARSNEAIESHPYSGGETDWPQL